MLNTLSRLPVPRRSQGLARVARLIALAACSTSAALAQEEPSPRTPDLYFPFVGDLDSFYNREVWWMSVPAIIMSILIFIATTWGLLYSVLKFRERKGDNREPAQFHGNHTLEIVLIAIPFLIVTVLSVLMVRSMARLNEADAYVAALGREPIQTEVLGAQFWWNFTYPELGGIVNGNEMVIPTGHPIQLNITARDVIHGFWAPNIGGQRTLIPGAQISYMVDTSKEGVFRAHCSQLCGASHANMKYMVVALPPSEFQNFVAAARAYEAPEPDTALERRGYEIFMEGVDGSASCAGCHRIQGTPAAGQAGPDLSFFATRRTLGAAMFEGVDAIQALPEWIKSCPEVKPGCLMPAYPELEDEDLAAVVAYMRSLELPEAADYWRLALNENEE